MKEKGGGESFGGVLVEPTADLPLSPPPPTSHPPPHPPPRMHNSVFLNSLRCGGARLPLSHAAGALLTLARAPTLSPAARSRGGRRPPVPPRPPTFHHPEWDTSEATHSSLSSSSSRRTWQEGTQTSSSPGCQSDTGVAPPPPPADSFAAMRGKSLQREEGRPRAQGDDSSSSQYFSAIFFVV